MRNVGARAQDPADLEAADDRQIQIQDDQVGLAIGDGVQRRVARADDERVGVAAALEGVLDEAGDIGFVFDNQYVRFGHGPVASVPAENHAKVSNLLIVG